MVANSLQNNEVKAVSKYIRTYVLMVVCHLEDGSGLQKRHACLLEFMPYASCEPIIKVLRSAAANARNNMNLDETNLVVKSAFADQVQ